MNPYSNRGKAMLVALWFLLAFNPSEEARAQLPEGSHLDEGQVASLLEARTQQKNGNYQKAESILNEAFQRAPGAPELLNALGSVQQDVGRYDQAEHLYLRALAASPAEDHSNDFTERISILNNLATLYLETDQIGRARNVRTQLEKTCAQGIDSYPIEAATRLLNVLASLESADGKYDEAATLFQQAIALEHKAYGPVSANTANVKNNLGYLLMKLKRYQSAISVLQESVAETEVVFGPEAREDVRPLINLAYCEILVGLGEHPKAAIGERRKTGQQ